MLRFLLPLACVPLILLPCSAEHGATKKLLETERAWNQAFKGKVLNERLPVRWLKDGKTVQFNLETELGTRVWHQIELERGTGRALSDDELKHIGKDAYAEPFKPVAPKQRRLMPSGPRSPDKAFRVEIKDRRIFLRKEVPGKLEQNQKGDDSKPARREMSGPPVTEGYKWMTRVNWSPTSDCFIAWKISTHPVRNVHFVRSSPAGQVQPEHFTKAYPKPGDDLNIARPVLFYVDPEREATEINKTLEELIGEPFKLENLSWRTDGERFTFEVIERGFGAFRVIEGHTGTGRARVLLAEEDEKFVCVYYNCFRHDFPADQEAGRADGDEILWLSERDGFNHLYLINGLDGSVIRQLTKGAWVVREVLHVDLSDPSKRRALVQVSGVYPDQDPYHLHLAMVGIDEDSFALLTAGDGTHQNVSWSPDRTHYVVTWSRVDHAPVHELRRLPDGMKVATLAKADASALLEAGFPVPERVVAKDRNGRFDIHGIIKRPPDFDPAKSYAVLESIYAGPHDSFVPKAWTTAYGTGSQLTKAGFIVVYIDGLGTRNRGKEFHQVCYKNLIDSGLPDRVKWIRSAAETRPEMDLERVGIYGGSAGGQSTLAGLLTQPGFYKAGAADCGCHDNRMDKIWWNEQWMDWPIDQSYANNSNLTHLEKLQGHVLLTVGEVDTNVDPSSTYQVVNGLIKADKDFDYYMVPNGGHGVGGSPYLKRIRTEFFQRHLGGPKAR